MNRKMNGTKLTGTIGHINKELETKELQANFIKCFKELLTKTDKDIFVVNISREMAQDMVNLYEKHLTINPSEALECLQSIIKDESIHDYILYNCLDEDFIKVRNSLLKAQEDKVIADFIREHYKLSNDINKNYLELKKPITMEEDIKFKEVF